jgi:hypothetical protein
MEKPKPQLLLIHGGMTFKTKKDYLRHLKTQPISIEERKKWSGEYLKGKLGTKFEIIRPQMPLKDNAKYAEWKIHFERHLPLLRDNIVLIGTSLGGIFLAKYLSENRFPKKILATYLIGAPFDDTTPTEDLCGGFKLKSDLSEIEKNSNCLTLLFSKDDPVIPVSHAKKYERKLKNAKITIFDSKNGHFQISEFPEIIKMLKGDLKRT